MIRALLATVLVTLIVAPAAGASIGLRDDLAAAAVAFAGDEVLVVRTPESGRVRLHAVPRAGGPARSLLTVSAPRAAASADVSLAASDQRVALIVGMRDRLGANLDWRIYSGPPSGPLRLVRRRRAGDRSWFPFIVDVEGDQALIVDVREAGRGRVRASLLGPGGFAPIPWVRDTFAPAAISGGQAAVYTQRPNGLVVADLATGAVQSTLDVYPSQLEAFDFAAGRLVAEATEGLRITPSVTLPGTKGLDWPRFAGDAVVALDEGRPVLVSGDGSRTALGEPSDILDDLVADARGAAWIANGCVRYAELAVPVPAQPDDPCPSTEIGLYAIADARLKGRRVHAPVKCVTAPGGSCRGTLIARRGGRIVGRGRFALPVGTEEWIPIILTRAEAAYQRRVDGTFVLLSARIRDGRVGAGRGNAELTIKAR